MSKNVAMFVDVANMYYAARGQDVDVDYVALLKHATKGRDLIRAYAYTGLDPENENQRKFIDFLAKNGYKPVVKDIRKFGDGRMKANLDIELVVDLFRLADRMDIAVADEFMDIMKVASISRKEGRAVRASMSAPEMPAKEVNPEFGFREASPSVAAQALAALKGGVAPSGNGRRTRGGTSRRSSSAAAAAAPEPEEAAVPVAGTEVLAEGDEQARRRRRRRGGRGRGRTRREGDGPAEAPAPGGAIGWEEFDDLSQLDGAEVEEREYTFTEVDPETLAELGLTPEEVEAMATGTPAVEDEASDQAVPKRRTRTRKAAAADPDADAKPKRRTRSSKAAAAPADADAEAKPKRRTRSRASTADTDAPAPSDADADAKPKSRSRSSKSAAKADVASEASPVDADGEPQGIWGRFRSARKPRAGTEA